MSKVKKRTAKASPNLLTAGLLTKSGFQVFDCQGLMSHPDGRVAAIRGNGTHQVFGSLAEAQRWLYDDSDTSNHDSIAD
jgi:hypothetical protein